MADNSYDLVVIGARPAGMAAAPAVADGHRPGGDSGNGAGSAQVYGNTTTGGYMSPQIGLVQGSFNWLVDNYSRIADWVSSLERVGGLLVSLDKLNHVTPPAGQPAVLPVQPVSPL